MGGRLVRRQNARVLCNADLAGGDDAVGRGHGTGCDAAGDGDAAGGDAGELDAGAGTRPGADPVPRPTMGGRLVRRQNARVLCDACVGAVTEPGADPAPRPTMGGPLGRRQNATVIRDAWSDPSSSNSSHPAHDESAAKRAKTRSHLTGHGAGGEGGGGRLDVKTGGLSLSNLKMSPVAYVEGGLLDDQQVPGHDGSGF